MDTAALIRRARQEANLSQLLLAERAGVSRFAVSRYESGSRTPSVETLEKILAAAGMQIKAELEPLDADVKAAIEQHALVPTGRRDVVVLWQDFDWLADLNYRLEGMAAAEALGAPVPVKVLDLALAEEPATFERIAERMVDRVLLVRPPDEAAYTMWRAGGDVPAAGRTIARVIGETCPQGWFWLRSGGTEAQVRLTTSEEAKRHVRVQTRHSVLQVQPFHEIDASGADVEARRVLRVMREMAAGGELGPADRGVAGTLSG